ncbi:MAG: hypothetical protein KAT56_06685 [Sedimentisphaerales bacterium]|nr:hypothetical protein [Sedimentisphaerales bacterium]
MSLRRDFGILTFVIVILLETGAGDYDDIAKPGKPTLRSSDFIQLKSAAMPRPSASIVFPGHIELSVHNDCDKELLVAIISQLKGSPC